MKDQERHTVSRANEQRVEDYFEPRGFDCKKLDTCDFRITKVDDGYRFLCEVKTIFSGGSRPSKEQIERHRARSKRFYEEYSKAHPDVHLLVSGKEYDFLRDNAPSPSGSRHTEDWYHEFISATQDHLANRSPVRSSPFSVYLSTFDFYIPYGREREDFWRWLEVVLRELTAVDREPGWSQHIYHFPTPDEFAFIQVYGPTESSELSIRSGGSGGSVLLNERAIEGEIEKAMGQLRTQAKKELPRIPLVVALASSSPFFNVAMELMTNFCGGYLGKLIERTMLYYLDLSAIAILHAIPKGPAPVGKDPIAFFEHLRSTEWVDAFFVFHNPYLSKTDPLDRSVFDDGYSGQFDGWPDPR